MLPVFCIIEKPDLMFDDSEGSVSQFIKLCPDPSLLGDRILDAVITLSVDQDLLSPQGMYCLWIT